MSTNAPHARAAVTAIIVSHDGARFLPALVQALKAQTYPVEQTVGVDTASSDDSRTVLAGLIGQDAVFGADGSSGFGEGVATALRHVTRRRSGLASPSVSPSGPGVTRAEWVWLLHDDCEPAPDALERLLRAAARDRAVAVVGPKLLDGQDRRTLREVGISIDRAGRRVTGIDRGEIDQGQHDHKRAVLAVSSAGMLVRRDVWDRLGGFDPNLKFFRDDLDFCWRVQAAGWRVQVATDAVVYHWELAGRRRRQLQGGGVRVIDQRNALFVLAVNLPITAMLRIVGGCVLGSLARAFYFLLTKQLDLCAAYGFSVLGLFAHPVLLFRARRRRSAGLAEGYYAVRVFIPPARTLTKLAEQIAGLVSSGPPSGRHQATAEESEEDVQFTDQASLARRVIGHPGVQLFLALLLITLVATRRLLGTSPLGGGALVPAWGGALALWQEYLASFHAVSVGSSAPAPPYLAVVAFLATLLGGQAWLAVDVLLLGCVPLAGLTAYLATRWVVTATPARMLLAASYALLPVATGIVAAGRLGTAVAFILLPLIAVSAGRMLTAAPRQARRAAWATGLLIGLAAAFAPFTWVLGALLAVAAVGVRRWLAAVDPLNAVIVAVTPFFVLFPWSLHLLASPSAFLSEAGPSVPGLTTHGLRATALLALSPGGPGVPPVWVTAGFALALAALLLPGRRLAVIVVGWAVAVTGLLAAVTLSRVAVTPPDGGQPAVGWPGIATALAGLGLLLASAPAAQWLVTVVQNGSGTLPSATASGRGRRSRRLLASAALIGAATAPLLVAGYWVTDGVRGPVGSVSAPLLPTFISASSSSGAQYRTLILRPDGAGLDYQVVRQGDPSLGQPDLGISAAAQAVLSRQVAALGARDGADAGDPGLVLGSFGIKWVMLPSPVDPVLASRLDAALGLVALNKGAAYDLWQVTGPVGRVRVVAPSGATRVLASATGGVTGAVAPASGGTLILAEPYGGWTATVNGRALKPVAAPVGGWAQGFVLPPGGGQLSITHNGLSRLLSLVLELLATLTVIVAALPGRRVDPAGEAEALTALREAKPSASRQRAASRRSAGAGRLRAGAGHRVVSRALSGADRLGIDRLGPGRKRRAGAAPAADEPPESPALGNQLPASPDAEPAELARAEAVTTTARPERGHGRHRGASGDAGVPGAENANAGVSDAGVLSADTVGAGPGGLPAAPWEAGDGWDSPGLAPARHTGQQPSVPESSSGEASSEKAGEASSVSVTRSPVADAGRGDGQSAGPDGAPPQSPPRAAGPLAPAAPSPDAEQPDGSDRRKPSSWKGALARLTGQQPALQEGTLQEGTGTEPGADAARPLADPQRRDNSDWLDELLRMNGVGQVPDAAEGSPSAPSRGTADEPDTSKSPAADDQARRSGRHAAGPETSPHPAAPASSPRPESPALGGPALRGPALGGPALGGPALGGPVPGGTEQEAPVPETSAEDSRLPWETEPQHAPWESGPQSPVSGAGSEPEPRKPWESGPQPPVRPAGGPSAPPADTPSGWRTAAKSAWETGSLPAARTGAQPAARTGAQPTFTPAGQLPTFTPSGPQPTFTPTGGQQAFTPSGAQPTFTPTGARPSAGTRAAEAAAAPTGTAPVSSSGNLPAEPGNPPADKPPWEAGDWGKAPDWDAIPGRRAAVPAAGKPGEASDGSDPAGVTGARPGPEPGNPPAAPPPAKPERHSHRGGKHGKPSRWRGPGGRSGGNRSGGDGES